MGRLKIVCFSVFRAQFIGHGGEKRSKQIEALLSGLGSYERIQCPFKFNRRQPISLVKLIWRSPYILKVLQYLRATQTKLDLCVLLHESYRFHKQETFLREREHLFIHADVVIWENNFPEFFYLSYILSKKYKKKIVACPHNIESLISIQDLNWHGKKRMRLIEHELAILRYCDAVFTISEEEQWLLNLFNINSKYLPYYPVGDLFLALMAIREYRINNTQDQFFLILGSTSNPPTKIGTIALLNSIRALSLRTKIKYRLKVTGYGTEHLSKDFGDDDIDILGFTDENSLNDLMKRCKAMIVSQAFSTGALTRIPEALVAGIPIISNEGASRTYRRTDGIYIYKCENDLAELLAMKLPIPPIPKKPDDHFNNFILENSLVSSMVEDKTQRNL